MSMSMSMSMNMSIIEHGSRTGRGQYSGMI